MGGPDRMKVGARNWAAVGATTLNDSSAVEVFAARNGRVTATIKNRDASINVFLGADDTVTTSSGVRLEAGQSLPINTQGAIYAIAASGAPVVDGWEEYDVWGQ